MSLDEGVRGSQSGVSRIMTRWHGGSVNLGPQSQAKMSAKLIKSIRLLVILLQDLRTSEIHRDAWKQDV